MLFASFNCTLEKSSSIHCRLSLSAVELYILGYCVIDTTYDGKAVRLWKREEALPRTQSLECTLSIMGSCQNGYLIYKASWTLSLSPFSSIKVAGQPSMVACRAEMVWDIDSYAMSQERHGSKVVCYISNFLPIQRFS